MDKNTLAHVVGIITVLIWGCTFVNTRYLLNAGLSAADIVVCRFSLAYICIWFISPRKLKADSWRDELLFVVLGITGGSLYFLTENAAVGHTLVNNVSFIVCTAPLFTMLLARLFYRGMRIGWKLAVGSIVALLGMGLVIFNGHVVLKLNPLGDMLALAAAICWAVYSLLIKYVSQGKYSAIFVTRKVFAYGLLTILPVFIFQPWEFPLSGFAEPTVWGNLLFLGLVASFACFVTWSWVIKQIGTLKASNYIYLNPVSTVIASAVALDEPMTLLAWLGSACILGGVALANSIHLDK